MASEGKQRVFGDLVDFVSEKAKAKEAVLATYISTENMQSNFGGVTTAATLPESGSVTMFKTGDTLFSNIRTYFKKVWQAEFDGHCSNDVLVFRTKDKAVLHPAYLNNLCRWGKFTEFSIRTSKGAKMPRGDKDALAQFLFELPPIKEQRAIAHILGKLDDKIDLNRRINQTLAAMAQAIFKSWFVDFDPVKAKIAAIEQGEDPLRAAMRAISGKTDAELDQMPREHHDQLAATASLFPDAMEESELGEIPEGWAVSDFGSVSTCFDKNRIPLSKRQREDKKGNIPYYGATSVMDYIDEHIFDGIFLLLGEDGSVLREDGKPFVQYIWGKSWVNNHAHVLQGSNGVSTEQLMLFISMENISAYVTGAVQLKLNQKNMNSIPFVKATKCLNTRFSDLIAPLYARHRSVVEEIRGLTELRDTLLPKLLSGELHVSDAEKFVARRGV